MRGEPHESVPETHQWYMTSCRETEFLDGCICDQQSRDHQNRRDMLELSQNLRPVPADRLTIYLISGKNNDVFKANRPQFVQRLKLPIAEQEYRRYVACIIR